MIYFDTNVIIYSVVNQGFEKMVLARKELSDARNSNQLVFSPLTLQELVFGLAKLKMNSDFIKKIFDTTIFYSNHEVDNGLISDAFKICIQLNYYLKINDCIHLKFAERYSNKLITFDKDFEMFRPHTKLEIEILN